MLRKFNNLCSTERKGSGVYLLGVGWKGDWEVEGGVVFQWQDNKRRGRGKKGLGEGGVEEGDMVKLVI